MANKQKLEAEDKLASYQAGSSPAGPGDDSRELRSKQVQVRDLQKKVDCLSGKSTALTSLSKAELKEL